MNSTCISHPERQPLIQIKAWQIYATDGNYCAAALLNFFEYWHNYKLDEQDKNIKRNNVAKSHNDDCLYDETLLQFHTEKELSEGLLGLYGESTINDAVKVLEKKNFISIHKNPNPKYKFDNTKYFLFNVDAVQTYIDDEYPERSTRKDVASKLVERFSKKKKAVNLSNSESKITPPESEITSPQGKITSRKGKITLPQGKITGTITKITSEITTEITSNTLLSSQASDIKNENIEMVDTRNSKNKGKINKRQLIKQKTEDPEFIKTFQSLREKYTLYSGNTYLRHFGIHKEQFYKTIAYRVAVGHMSPQSLEEVFYEMTKECNFSIMQFLERLKTEKYGVVEILTDFIWIMNDGRIAAPSAEKKGAKELSEWVDDGMITLTEIEDCFLWIPNSGRGYKLSLISMKAALSEFNRVKSLEGGRYVGRALNGNVDKYRQSVETLKQRDYNSSAKEALAQAADKKARIKELIEQGR